MIDPKCCPLGQTSLTVTHNVNAVALRPRMTRLSFSIDPFPLLGINKVLYIFIPDYRVVQHVADDDVTFASLGVHVQLLVRSYGIIHSILAHLFKPRNILSTSLLVHLHKNKLNHIAQNLPSFVRVPSMHSCSGSVGFSIHCQ